jgi:hypothetical protein
MERVFMHSPAFAQVCIFGPKGTFCTASGKDTKSRKRTLGSVHSWNFGLAVSYLEGELREQLSSQDTKLSEVQLWSAFRYSDSSSYSSHSTAAESFVSCEESFLVAR